MNYLGINCPNCNRVRVETNGVCEKCGWDVDGDNFASITRPPPLCVVCKGEADRDTGRCLSAHWHGLGGGPTTLEERIWAEWSHGSTRDSSARVSGGIPQLWMDELERLAKVRIGHNPPPKKATMVREGIRLYLQQRVPEKWDELDLGPAPEIRGPVEVETIDSTAVEEATPAPDPALGTPPAEPNPRA